jgi:hypothetical protein
MSSILITAQTFIAARNSDYRFSGCTDLDHAHSQPPGVPQTFPRLVAPQVTTVQADTVSALLIRPEKAGGQRGGRELWWVAPREVTLGLTQRPGQRQSRPLCVTTSRAGPRPAQGII